MVGRTIVRAGIMLVGIVVVFKWKQRQAGHIAYWQQQRAVEERQGEAAAAVYTDISRGVDKRLWGLEAPLNR